MIKVLPQPLSKMSSGMPQVGSRVATAAFYMGADEELDHWNDFTPVVVDIVTANQQDIQRVTRSIDQADWQELSDAMPQVPTPYKPGLYRVYSAEELSRPVVLTPELIPGAVMECLSDLRYAHFANRNLDAENYKKAASYAGPATMQQAIAIVESAKASSDAKEGFVFTPHQVFFNFSELGSGSFQWNQVGGAFMSPANLEIALRDGRRMAIPNAHLLTSMRIALERLFRGVNEGY